MNKSLPQTSLFAESGWNLEARHEEWLTFFAFTVTWNWTSGSFLSRFFHSCVSKALERSNVLVKEVVSEEEVRKRRYILDDIVCVCIWVSRKEVKGDSRALAFIISVEVKNVGRAMNVVCLDKQANDRLVLLFSVTLCFFLSLSACPLKITDCSCTAGRLDSTPCSLSEILHRKKDGVTFYLFVFKLQ